MARRFTLRLHSRRRDSAGTHLPEQSIRIIELQGACSSAGRAPALQAGGHRFDPGHVHQLLPECKGLRKITSARRLCYSCTLCTNCARMRHWSTSLHNGAVEKASASPTDTISFARRLSFSRASRFIRNFIWEYFLKTCASLWRSSCVTHSSATPPALSLVA